MARTGKAGTWRGVLAALALLALVVQGLVPGAAMAAEMRGSDLPICSQGQVKFVHLGEQSPVHKGFAGMACADCAMASVTAVASPEPMSVPVAYAVETVRFEAQRLTGVHAARAPPRPPSQGPPQDL